MFHSPVPAKAKVDAAPETGRCTAQTCGRGTFSRTGAARSDVQRCLWAQSVAGRPELEDVPESLGASTSFGVK